MIYLLVGVFLADEGWPVHRTWSWPAKLQAGDGEYHELFELS